MTESSNTDKHTTIAEDDAHGITATSFLTPATNPSIPSSGRHSIDFSDKAPQVMEWTSTIAISKDTTDHNPKDQTQDSGARTPTSASAPASHDTDLEELHQLTPTLVEVPAPDIPTIQNLTLGSTTASNPSYLSSKPYSISGHYARGLDVPSVVPSPPSSIIAEPPSPTLSHASLKMGSTYSSTSSNAGEDQDQYQDQDQDQDQEQDQNQDQEMEQPPFGLTNTIVDDSTTATQTGSTSHISTNPSQKPEQSGRMNENHDAFAVPRKEILTKDDLELFHVSASYASLFEFLEALNESIIGVVSTAECYESEVVKGMLETLDLVNDVAEEYPPESGHESRFGNPAFRKFYDQVGL
ncbi:Serine/threonine-protein phosphatase 2A activator 2, partial [Lobosporangium transversale]